MSDIDHAPDCALVLYAGKPTLKPLICDCEASDVGEPASVEHAVEATPVGPVVTLTGGAAKAMTEYRRVVIEHRKREGVLLAKLTEELAK
jgi:hypothetical protein